MVCGRRPALTIFWPACPCGSHVDDTLLLNQSPRQRSSERMPCGLRAAGLCLAIRFLEEVTTMSSKKVEPAPQPVCSTTLRYHLKPRPIEADLKENRKDRRSQARCRRGFRVGGGAATEPGAKPAVQAKAEPIAGWITRRRSTQRARYRREGAGGIVDEIPAAEELGRGLFQGGNPRPARDRRKASLRTGLPTDAAASVGASHFFCVATSSRMARMST